MARLRNSWGADWGDEGHTDLAIDALLATQEKYSGQHGLPHKHHALWITSEHSPHPVPRSRLISDDGDFLGHVNTEFTGHRMKEFFKNGGFTRNRSGELVMAHNVEYKRGLSYRGTVVDLGGTWAPRRGHRLSQRNTHLYLQDETRGWELLYRILEGNYQRSRSALRPIKRSSSPHFWGNLHRSLTADWIWGRWVRKKRLYARSSPRVAEGKFPVSR